jgi:hypothetical protein
VHDLPQSSGEPNDNLVKLVSFDFTGRIWVFHEFLPQNPSSLLNLLEWDWISLASLMIKSIYLGLLGLLERTFLLWRWMQHPQLTCPNVLARCANGALPIWFTQKACLCNVAMIAVTFQVSSVKLHQPEESRDFRKRETNQLDGLPWQYFDSAAKDWLSTGRWE